MDKAAFSKKTARFLRDKEPFFFLVNFDKSQMAVHSFEEATELGIYFDIKGKQNFPAPDGWDHGKEIGLQVDPFPFKSYLEGFEKVIGHLKKGNTFLVNLTFPNKIKGPIGMEDVFLAAKAPYKLAYKDRFVCFSPECFIQIKGNYIYSYPMKGTIDASLKDAKSLLLHNVKEEQEHHTIVDLIRNDLSIIAREVKVTKFRYLEKIRTVTGEIWQTSSEIRGTLPADWKAHFGDFLFKLLPAGSISGAPKAQTLAIIKEVENYDRGFYTGIFGIYDGTDIDCGVAIRFIEKEGNGYWYKSGGGITHQSNVKEEYIELINKIYIPTV